MNNIHLICNPTSGKGSASETLEKIKEWLKLQNNLSVTIHVTENIGHATIIAQDLTSGNEPVTLLVLGGDGTLNEVLNGINNFKMTQVGVLPFGSGNDFAAAMGFEKENDPVALVNHYITNPISRPIDYLLINDKYKAINAVGTGMSAETIAFRNKMKHFKPSTQYKIATFVKALFWKAQKQSISTDKKAPEQYESVWTTLNNGICIGGGIVTAPDSALDDGLISVTVLNKFPRIKTLSLLSKVKKGKVAHIEQFTRWTAKEIDLESPQEFTLEYDGVLLEKQTKVNIKVVHNQLNILIPKR